MRNLHQVLIAASLLTNQVAAAFPHVATASAQAQATAVVKVETVQLNTASPEGVVGQTIKVPDFNAEVLQPLEAARAAAKAQAAAAAEAAHLAAIKASQTASRVIASGVGPLSTAQINFLGNCESGMTATRNSGNGFYGAFQFTIGTWNSMSTGYARADLAPLDVQIDAVQRLLSRSSIFSQFPGCARQMQAQGLI